MPEIKVPEVKLQLKTPEVKLAEMKLPDGLRDVTREDIQKAVGEILPKVDLPKRGSIAKEIEKALPRRAAPSPLPFVFLGMLGGLFVGVLLATLPATGPRVNSLMWDLRGRLGERRGRGSSFEEEEWTSPSSGEPSGMGVGPGRPSETTSPMDGFGTPTESASVDRF